jgi:TIR domain-containing protein
MMSAEIVISYRSEDSGSAGRLYDRLEEHFGPEAVFMDKARLRGGVSFPEEIATVIRGCKVVIAVVTPVNWSTGIAERDDWVRRELTEALGAGKQVMPVRMHGAPPPGAGLPPDLEALAKLHARSIDDDDFDDDTLRVIDDLRELVAPPPPEVAFPELPEQGRIEKREAWGSSLRDDRATAAVEAALRAHSIKLDGVDEEGRTRLKGGNPLLFRLLGAPLTKREAAPLKGYLRIGTGPFASIELLLVEELRGSSTIGLADRYELRFGKVFEAVKKATGGN